MIIPLALLTLPLPDLTISTATPTLTGFQSAFLIVICLALYGTFLAIQTLRHRGYFTDPAAPDENGPSGHGVLVLHSVPFHALLLLAYLMLIFAP